ncbi:MAG: hypothetical protein KatS3mg105_1246 [Gemmatales bacterium]|nr:MAG: hypothetical protein KatS3mg105_1246 [Gemmatales bacterium]
MADLITLDRARQNLPASTNDDEPVIATLITSASRAVERFCRRVFVATPFDETYDGTGETRLYLRQFPVIRIDRVRNGLKTVLRIKNGQTANEQARVSVSDTGLSLVRVSGGVPTTATIAFAANPTLSTVKDAVVALGNGWQAEVASGFATWPSADLRPQGAFDAAGRFADIRMHTAELTNYSTDHEHGVLFRRVDGPFASAEHVTIWPIGVGRYRIEYTAGFTTVPEDVQEATAQLVATFFKELGRNQNLQTESVVSTHSYNAVRDNSRTLPRSIRVLLLPYRNHRV